jgi:hypothetical protein
MVMRSSLPQSPDFESMDAKGARSAGQRSQVLGLVGNLIFSWSNNESMFIYLLMLLLETDIDSATIVFITLNTTRARLDLIRRLAKSKLKDPRSIRKIERLIDRFNRCTKVRNEFNHCIYQLNEFAEITHTNSLKITESSKGIQIADRKNMDEARIKEITNAIRRLKKLNKDIWAFLPQLEKQINAQKAAVSAKS